MPAEGGGGKQSMARTKKWESGHRKRKESERCHKHRRARLEMAVGKRGYHTYHLLPILDVLYFDSARLGSFEYLQR